MLATAHSSVLVFCVLGRPVSNLLRGTVDDINPAIPRIRGYTIIPIV